jgi:non-specific serine/threonine protein kinase/serine/threonine-protein kinase
MRAGLHSQEALSRFQSERQTLAFMDHPAIAKVFDVGSTPFGQPFFAMEFIEGIAITDYCDEHCLDIRSRLELFLRVCEGVTHAHQKAVIHRDLKPSNILVYEVDGKAYPKIIDFGVSKAVSGQEATEPALTKARSIIGTPQYMSPEQGLSGGRDVDIRTDVYSLGVILFELLSGERPVDFADVDWNQILRRFERLEVSRPSSVYQASNDQALKVAAHRRTTKGTLIRQLQGDLDAIALKALERDRSRRYGSVADLAADIKRALQNEPVSARAPSVAYRTKKYIVRHRYALIAATTGVLLLLSFLTNRAIDLNRIESERDRADRVTKFMTSMFKISNPSESRGRQVTAHEILDKASGEISSGLQKDPELQVQLMDTMQGVYYNLGLYLQAEKLASQALKVRTRILGPEHRQTLETMDNLAFLMGVNGQLAQGEPLQRRVFEASRRIFGPDDSHTLVAEDTLGSILNERDKYAEAEKLLREAVVRKARRFGPEAPITLISIDNLANVLDNEGRYKESEQLHRRVVDARARALGRENPETLRVKSNLAWALIHMSRYAEAEGMLESVRDSQTKILGRDHPYTAESTYKLATIAALTGHAPKAIALLRDAVDHGLLATTVDYIPSDPDFRTLHKDPRFRDLLVYLSSGRKAKP